MTILELPGPRYVCDRLVFTPAGSSYDAWGQRRIAGRLFDLATMTVQRDAVVTGPPWASDLDLVTAGFRLAGIDTE